MSHLSQLRFPASYLELAEKAVRSQDGDIKEEVHKPCEFDPSDTDSYNQGISGIQMLQVIRILYLFATSSTENSHKLFQLSPPTVHGKYGLALLTCPTFKDGISIAERYIERFNPIFNIQTRYSETHCEMVFEQVIDVAEFNDFFTELVLGIGFTGTGWGVFSGIQAPQLSTPCYVKFKHAKPVLEIPWALGNYEIEMGAEVNSVSLPLSMLNIENGSANRAIYDSVIAELEIAAEEESYNSYSPVSDMVKSILSVELEKGRITTQTETANLLKMSARTLSRRLKEESTSFQFLAVEQRMKEAKQLLENSTLSISQIALTLGFSSEANFSRAFKKHSALTPSQFRERKV